jgi:hypothetical protein
VSHPATAEMPRALRTGLTAGVLTILVMAVYGFGFRAFGLDWVDAMGASGAHVLPGAVVATGAWQLQAGILRLPVWGATLAHLCLAPLAGAVWMALTLVITWVARPDLVATVGPAAAPGTLMSGVAVYLVVAAVFSTLDGRRRVAVRDAALARAQLAQLRARVEPHFLFNTLETISALVHDRPAAAEDAIARLGRILRRVMEQPQEAGPDGLVPLAEELALVRDYLAIARLRMGHRLRVIEGIETDALDLGVPAFALQTLVENAVLHGLGPSVAGGTLSISAMREGRSLVLVVADDGVGADEDGMRTGGQGLQLVRARLEAHFGGRGTMDIAAERGLGVSVRLSMPAEQAE